MLKVNGILLTYYVWVGLRITTLANALVRLSSTFDPMKSLHKIEQLAFTHSFIATLVSCQMNCIKCIEDRTDRTQGQAGRASGLGKRVGQAGRATMTTKMHKKAHPYHMSGPEPQLNFL